MSLSAKLLPAALWLGGKTIFPKIGKVISDHFVSNICFTKTDVILGLHLNTFTKVKV